MITDQFYGRAPLTLLEVNNTDRNQIGLLAISSLMGL